MTAQVAFTQRKALWLVLCIGSLLFLTAANQPGCNTYYADNDGDGHGNSEDTTGGGSTPPPGYVTDDTDCNDFDPSVYSGANEIPYDGIDQDCDGVDLIDADSDGVVAVEAGGDDCDDQNATAYPGAVSVQSGLSMAYICNGSFVMGSPESEVGRESNEVQHTVTLSHAFYAGMTEVTQAQFQAALGYNPSGYKSCGGNCPVETVSWSEAAAFANALSASASLPACYTCTGSGPSISCSQPSNPYLCRGYRLPTEAEWEYATRAGETAAFPNGGNLQEADISRCSGSVTLVDAALQPVDTLSSLSWYCGNNNPAGTKPVAQLTANAWGLYDVIGNVYEWCHEGFDDYSSDAIIDPVGVTSSVSRVVRGPGFMDEPLYQRSAYRSDASPTSRSNLIGFRVVRAVM